MPLPWAYAEEAQGSARPAIDPGHLNVHLARHLRWVLQWAPNIDAELTGQVLDLVPRVLAALPAAR
ncbi:hypothetical protein J0910_30700 [Nocardiopsis sp. CNT-189]|uniref:hypothetical protein n=1 Tax=Nocardiopsis oceanisediminis TaxID=2816862 RepID=UPI003B36A90B